MAAVHAILRHNGEEETNDVRGPSFRRRWSFSILLEKEVAYRVSFLLSRSLDRCRFLFGPAWNGRRRIEGINRFHVTRRWKTYEME